MIKNLCLLAGLTCLLATGPADCANLLARYLLDGDSTDSSGNAYDGTDTDVSYVVDGVRGTVASFNGTSSSIDLYNGGSGLNYSLGDQGPNSVNSTVTISMWIKPTAQLGANSTPDSLVLLGGDDPGKGVIEIVGDTAWGGMGGGAAQGGVGINSGGGGGKTGKVDTVDLYDGNWHHVVLQWAGDPNSDIEVWIDNMAATTYGNGYNGSAADPNALRLGGPAVWSNGGSADKHYGGLMSDLQLYDGALTPAEVDNIYTTGVIAPTALVLEPVLVSDVAYNEAMVSCGATLATDDVTVYWGTSDPGETEIGWTGAPVSLGAQAAGSIPSTISGLAENTTYYFRYHGSITSPAEEDWSPVGTFTTPLQNPLPILGAPSTTMTYADGADVEAQLTGADASTTWIVWDTVDQGTPATPPGSWSNSAELGAALEDETLMAEIRGESTATMFTYRFFATNAGGDAWSEAGSFLTEPAPPTTNLLARYQLDGDATDSSGNDYDGIDIDVTYVTDGERGTVASFNGTTSSIDLYNGGSGLNYSLGDQGANSANSTVTISMWIKPTAQLGDNSTPDSLVLLGGDDPGKGVIEIVGDTAWGGMGGGAAQGGVGINSGGGGGKTGKVDTVDLYDGNWHHVVLQWAGDPNSDIEVWIDNMAATTYGNGYNGSAADPNALRLGGPAVWSNGGSADKYYVGLMSDVQLFDGVLSANDVDDLYNQGSIVPAGLVLKVEPSGDDLTFIWNSQSGKVYDLLSSTTLTGTPDTWPVWQADIPATPMQNMETFVRPGDVARFFVVVEKDAPPLLEEDFESGAGGFTAVNHTTGTIWAVGDPDSTGEGGTIDMGNGGSANCWGTDIGNPGVYATGTETSLISPIIDLTGVTGATLSFAQAIDIFTGDTLVVNIIDDTTDSVIESAIHTSTPDGNVLSADWETIDEVSIGGAALGQPVRIEWRFTGTNDNETTYLGAYIDDVVVTLD